MSIKGQGDLAADTCVDRTSLPMSSSQSQTTLRAEVQSFESLVKAYRYDKDRDHTHTYFGCGGTGKLSVPEDERPAFYSAYQRYLSTKDAFTLNGRGWNSFTEKSQPVLNMFADLDLKMPLFEDDRIDIRGAVVLIRDITDTFYEVLKEATGNEELEYPITAYRMFYKCHIYFPGFPVSRDMAKALCADVKRRLAPRYPWLDEEEVIDTSVYTSGLRVLGSHKGSMAAKTSLIETQRHMKFFGDAVPYHHFYRLGQLQDDGSVLFQDGITIDDLQKTSIICPSGTRSLAFCPGYASPTRVSRKRSQRQVSLSPRPPTRKQTASSGTNVLDEEEIEIEEEEEGASQAERNGGEADEGDQDEEEEGEQDDTPFHDEARIVSYLRHAFSILRNGLRPLNLQATIHSIKRYPDSGVVVAVLGPQECPFAMREHRRTTERSVPAVYAVLTSQECSVKCSKCEGQRLSLTPPSESLSDVLHFSPDIALRASLVEPSHENISEFIFQILKDKFAATPMTENGNFVWHFYDKHYHRWIRREQIIAAISGNKGPVKTAYRTYMRNLKEDASMDPDKLAHLKKRWVKLRFDLGQTPFIRSGLLPLLARKFDHYWSYEKAISPGIEGFCSKLDDDPRLLGFRNGVWDCSTGSFRPGNPSDFISMSTHVDYVPYDNIPRDVRKGLEGFLKKIFPSEEYLLYTLREIAASLNGTPAKQRFFIMTGAGANGKSTLVRLLNLALGDYAGEVSITLFTHQRPSADRPTPELIQIKGKRFVSCSEPNAKDSMNLGTIKWLTGGDRITGRALRENNQSFYLQATFFCLTNDIPPINATQEDYGTWRRIKPVCFKSKFVDDPNPSNPNEKLSDPHINDRLEEWKAAFASLLVKSYIESQTQPPVPIPNEFRALWQQLQNRNDVFRRFVKEAVTACEDNFSPTQLVWDTMNLWLQRMRIRKDVQFDHFEGHMITILGPQVEVEGVRGWYIELRTLAAHG